MTLATPAALRTRLRALGDPARARFVEGYLKTGPGQYGEGDRCLGVRVPEVRQLVREFTGAPLPAAKALLRSPMHEERLLALLLLVRAYPRGAPAEQVAIYRCYLAHTAYINNWDLVDASAPHIVGAHLEARRRAPLDRLARSPVLWERRIAIIATAYFIRRGELAPTLRLAGQLVHDPHDLIHKAVGWMLREVAKRDRPLVERFLRTHAGTMPRVMLRYAIERFPPRLRRACMAAGATA